MNSTELRKLLRKHRVMSTLELAKALGSRMAITRAVRTGILVPLGSGIYSSLDVDPFTAMILGVSRYYPKAIFSNITALVLHGLSDESLDKVDIDIDRKTSLRNRLFRIHRVSIKKQMGITRMRFKGEEIRIYDLERSLSEAYRIDPGGAIFFKALKRYLKNNKNPQFDRIQYYDSVLGTKVFVHLRQELFDD